MIFTSRAAAESYSGNRCCSWEGDIWLLCLLRSLCTTESSWEGDIWVARVDLEALLLTLEHPLQNTSCLGQ